MEESSSTYKRHKEIVDNIGTIQRMKVHEIVYEKSIEKTLAINFCQLKQFTDRKEKLVDNLSTLTNMISSCTMRTKNAIFIRRERKTGHY